MNPTELLRELTARLEAVADPERAAHDVGYLKSDLTHLGVSLPETRKIVTWLRGIPEAIAEPWPLVELCWSTGVYEHRSAMGLFLERANLGIDATPRIEKLLRDSHTWALVDQIAVQVLPRAKPTNATLQAWAADADVWIRRSALLCDLKALRKGSGNFDKWAKLAIPNLADPDVRIRKTIGWVLREVGKKRPHLTAQFVAAHEAELSGLSMREATRNLERYE